MAAEHTFKLLLSETKKGNGNGNKRPRADDQAPPEVPESKKAPKPRKSSKAKTNAT